VLASTTLSALAVGSPLGSAGVTVRWEGRRGQTKQHDEIDHARFYAVEEVVGRILIRPDALDAPGRASHLVALKSSGLRTGR
jgi:hypothetical protein